MLEKVFDKYPAPFFFFFFFFFFFQRHSSWMTMWKYPLPSPATPMRPRMPGHGGKIGNPCRAGFHNNNTAEWTECQRTWQHSSKRTSQFFYTDKVLHEKIFDKYPAPSNTFFQRHPSWMTMCGNNLFLHQPLQCDHECLGMVQKIRNPCRVGFQKNNIAEWALHSL